jgi:hypothetical protein
VRALATTLPILSAAPSHAPRDDLSEILLAAPSRAYSFSCAIKRPSRRFVDYIGCAIARPSRRLFVAILLAAQFTPVTTIRRLYWLRHRAPLATIICRHSFGCAIYAPRDNMS